MLLSINYFVREHDLKTKATSNLKIQQVLCFTGLNNVGIYLRVGPFASDIGVGNLNPSKGTHWVCYIDRKYFDSYGVVCPKKSSKFIKKRNSHCLY